jgi:spore coat polysaccharide biosynthesis predicted glycosyltransferase SpsG
VAPAGLADALATAAVAVVAGGLTLYEACALGTPVVALAVVPAQQFAIRAAAAAGAVIDASAPTPAQAITRAADGVVRLLTHPGEAARQGARASRLVDGAGAARVARHLEALAASSPRRERRHVA